MSDRLTLDINCALQEQVGTGGLRREDLEALSARARAIHDELTQGQKEGRHAFLGLPKDAQAAKAAVDLARELCAGMDSLLVLGIGGSSLGAKALFTALCHPFHNQLPAAQRKAVRLYFPDNSDAGTFAGLLDVVDLPKTAIAAITKSGGTAETWAQLLILRERLRKEGGEAALKRQLVAITDPSKGALRSVATAEGWRTLPVPPAVGGRFSVFTAVGLLPAAAAGIDVQALLAGAADMAARCADPDVLKNPAYLFASVLYLMDTQHRRRIHVFMPYADALRETADWFVQLWAESLGKKAGEGAGGVGPTPLRAVGATDQHSLLQLLMEGPHDKLTVFVALERPRMDLPLPRELAHEPDVAYLGGHSLHALLSAEQRATAAALAVAGRPSVTLRMPALTAHAMGELLMLLELATAFAGPLYGVNPYDQPGVEACKRYACGLLGRPGYEAARTELERRPAPRPEWIV
jgi:glucose-6-phosphate isomerase